MELWKDREKRDLFRLRPWEAAELLDKHLNWDKSHEWECNLMSWTSSLLFAIQCGIYRHGHRKRDLEAIEAFKDDSQGLADMQNLRTRTVYYFGEYLTQGHLNIEGRCRETSVQQMIDLGSFDLCPRIGDRECWHEWAKQVVALRSVIQEPCSAARTENSDVRKAITIAQGCFGDRWALPVAAMLLSLKLRQQDDPAILDGFRAMFTDTEIEALSLRNIKIDSSRLPEVKQYKNIIRDLSRHFGEGDTMALVSPFKRLTSGYVPAAGGYGMNRSV